MKRLLDIYTTKTKKISTSKRNDLTTTTIRIIMKRQFLKRSKTILLYTSACFFLLLFCLYFIAPIRNLLFYSFWPYRWRTISTGDLLRMYNPKRPDNVTDLLHCPSKVPPSLQPSEVLKYATLLSYPKATEDNEFFKRDQNHRFLPGVSYQDRIDFMWMYLVVAHALEKANVPFFFCNGALLGVYRHGGRTPWDTDIDIVTNVTHWQAVRRVLSCIEGVTLKTKPFMAWKVFKEGSHFPFVDIFFFTENEDYVWALTHYEFNSLIYEKRDVLPLTTAMYEGVLVPVPARMDLLMRRQFDPEYCIPPSLNYKNGDRHSQTPVLCSSLSSVYPMQNLKF